MYFLKVIFDLKLKLRACKLPEWAWKYMLNICAGKMKMKMSMWGRGDWRHVRTAKLCSDTACVQFIYDTTVTLTGSFPCGKIIWLEFKKSVTGGTKYIYCDDFENHTSPSALLLALICGITFCTAEIWFIDI